MTALLANARPLALRPAILPSMGLRRARGASCELWEAPDGTPRYYVVEGRVYRFLDVVADA